MSWKYAVAGYLMIGAAVAFYRAGKGVTQRTPGEAIESAIAASLIAWWVIVHA